MQSQEKANKIGDLIVTLSSVLKQIKDLDTDRDERIRRYIINPLACVIETWDQYGFDLSQWQEEVYPEVEEE
jgi:hypothetical protein